MKEIGYEDFMTIDTAMSRSLSVINGITCVVGSLGNMTLIAIILLHKQLHGASELLLMSLALADFVSCAIYLPLLLIRLNTSEKLPTMMNQSRRAIGQAAVVCVSLSLFMLTADRLLFFYRPLRYAYWMRRKAVIMIIIIIYLISFTVGLYAYYDMIKSQYLKIAFVGVPMLLFFLLHYAICRLAATHRSQVANQQLSVQYNYHVTSTVMVQARRNVRTVMLFGILYLLTWLPVTIFQLWRSVTDHHDPSTFQKYFYLLLTIQQISAAIDPYLCCYRNNKVKAVFRKLVPKRNQIDKMNSSAFMLANTPSLSGDGLDSSPRKSWLGVGDQVMTTAGSLDSIKTIEDVEYLDKILDQTVAGMPALNAYHGIGRMNNNKTLLVEKRNSFCVEYDSDKVRDLSMEGKPSRNVTESAENIQNTKIPKDRAGVQNTVESKINKIIDIPTEGKQHTVNLFETTETAKDEDLTTGEQQNLMVTVSGKEIPKNKDLTLMSNNVQNTHL